MPRSQIESMASSGMSSEFMRVMAVMKELGFEDPTIVNEAVKKLLANGANWEDIRRDDCNALATQVAMDAMESMEFDRSLASEALEQMRGDGASWRHIISGYYDALVKRITHLRIQMALNAMRAMDPDTTIVDEALEMLDENHNTSDYTVRVRCVVELEANTETPALADPRLQTRSNIRRMSDSIIETSSRKKHKLNSEDPGDVMRLEADAKGKAIATGKARTCGESSSGRNAHRSQIDRSAQTEIASSDSGEVKLFASGIDGPVSQMPNMKDVYKKVEASYKSMKPSFSVANLLKQICQCASEMVFEQNGDEGGNIVNANEDPIATGGEESRVIPAGDQDCCSVCFGDCLAAPEPCVCRERNGGEFAYTRDGLIKEQFLDQCISMKKNPANHNLFVCEKCPREWIKNDGAQAPCRHLIKKFVKECWKKCGCSEQCGNRVVQSGSACKLEVFFKEEVKGWGVRTLDALPRGSFVCEYVGEILTSVEMHDRTKKNRDYGRNIRPILLDADLGSKKTFKDQEVRFLDATSCGNVARFINYECHDANLIEIPVEVETPEHHYYHVALFTTRKVEALEELTWDYGIGFDDNNQHIKAF